MRISDWSSDVCSSDLLQFPIVADADLKIARMYDMIHPEQSETAAVRSVFIIDPNKKIRLTMTYPMSVGRNFDEILRVIDALQLGDAKRIATPADWQKGKDVRSEEHTSEIKSIKRTSYAVFCMKTK